MTDIPISTDPGYSVRIADGILSAAGDRLAPILTGARLMLVTDAVVAPLYADAVTASLVAAGFAVDRVVLPAGESAKTPATLLSLLTALAERQFRRSDALVALGGGVVSDLTGLAAALYCRGIRYATIPTTLLAAVDASVGGKTAVNLDAGKNLVGCFWQPSAVLCDPAVLAALPGDRFAEGMAEAVKCDLIRDNGALSALERGAARRELSAILRGCIELKRDLVEQDERDHGARRALNMGHTVAHAIEQMSGYTVPHGRAVAAGLIAESTLSMRLGLCPPALVRRVRDALTPLCGDAPIPADLVPLVPAMQSDKKNAADGRIGFVLPTDAAPREIFLTAAELASVCADAD